MDPVCLRIFFISFEFGQIWAEDRFVFVNFGQSWSDLVEFGYSCVFSIMFHFSQIWPDLVDFRRIWSFDINLVKFLITFSRIWSFLVVSSIWVIFASALFFLGLVSFNQVESAWSYLVIFGRFFILIILVQNILGPLSLVLFLYGKSGMSVKFGHSHLFSHSWLDSVNFDSVWF